MPRTKTKTPRLTNAQASFLRRLFLDGGYSRLYHASYQTAVALRDKGMVEVELLDPVNGRVTITEDGKRVAKAIVELLSSQKGRIAVHDILSKAEGSAK